MSERKAGDMNDRSYTVRRCEYGVWVEGMYAPCDEVSALLKAWHYAGLRYVSIAVAQKLGALVAVTTNVETAGLWLGEG